MAWSASTTTMPLRIRSTQILQRLRTSVGTPSGAFTPKSNPQVHRTFHASPRYRDVGLIQTTSEAIQYLHTITHLPWALTIPLTALSVRLIFVLPMTNYTRGIYQRQFNIKPLLEGWRKITRAKVMNEFGHLGPATVKRAEDIAMYRKRSELFKRWNCESWKLFVPFLQLPIFLVAMESIRSLSGATSGLWGLLFNRATSQAPKVAFENASRPMNDYNATIGGQIETTAQTDLVPLTFDPTMTTEGALWFPDLTVADPYCILPAILSASMLLNIFSKPAARKTSEVAESIWSKRLPRMLGVMALVTGPLTMNFPAALHLYWISGSLMSYITEVLLAKFKPLKFPPKPCKF